MIETMVLPDAAALAEAAANSFVELARQAISARDRFLVALAGGSTPLATYALLAGEVCAGLVGWTKVHVFWGDERCVGPDDRQSNHGQAQAALLERVPVLPENIHRIRGELPPDEAAALYEDELRGNLGPEGRLDLVVLGLGTDGHTASLFPGLPAVREQERWVAAHFVESVQAWRVTLTPPILTDARQVTFIVSGAAKASVLKAAIEGPRDPDALPASLFRGLDAPVLWLVDADAAVHLSSDRG